MLAITIHNFLFMIAGDTITDYMDTTVTRSGDLTPPAGGALSLQDPIRRHDMTGEITIRSSTPADASAIRDLALLDGGRAPHGAALLAYVDGQLRVAVGKGDGAAVSDPFHLTADLVSLVRERMAQERRRERPAHGLLARLAPLTRSEARA
jgi:hypothetical protein